jgi:hypothetical protein
LISVLDDIGDLLPVEIEVKTHTEPTTSTDVRWNEKPPPVSMHQRVLRPRWCVAPERQPPVIVMVVHEHDERPFAAPKERRGAVAQTLFSLWKAEAKAAHAFASGLIHDRSVLNY